MKKIKNIPEFDRPREKMEKNGCSKKETEGYNCSIVFRILERWKTNKRRI